MYLTEYKLLEGSASMNVPITPATSIDTTNCGNYKQLHSRSHDHSCSHSAQRSGSLQLVSLSISHGGGLVGNKFIIGYMLMVHQQMMELLHLEVLIVFVALLLVQITVEQQQSNRVNHVI